MTMRTYKIRFLGGCELIDEALKHCSTYHIDGGGEDAILEMVLANAGMEGQLVASDKDEVVFLVTPGRQSVTQQDDDPEPPTSMLTFARSDPDPEDNPNDDPPLHLN